jgi:hypothetical protein
MKGDKILRCAGFGCESFGGVSCTVFTDGDCLWDLSLGRHTGDGKFDGEVFLGRLWMVFLGGSGGGRERVGFHWTTLAFK